jgi:aspartate-semialdehyde dehydrogenase
VVGATGEVGEEMIATLEQREFPVEKLRLYATKRSAGKTLGYDGRNILVEMLRKDSFTGTDIALFSAGGERSAQRAPLAEVGMCGH